jgi:hypothetical protein
VDSSVDLTQGLQPVEVSPDHSVPPVGFGDRAATCEHGERRSSIVPEKEPYSPPPVRRFRHREVKVGINFVPR